MATVNALHTCCSINLCTYRKVMDGRRTVVLRGLERRRGCGCGSDLVTTVVITGHDLHDTIASGARRCGGEVCSRHGCSGGCRLYRLDHRVNCKVSGGGHCFTVSNKSADVVVGTRGDRCHSHDCCGYGVGDPRVIVGNSPGTSMTILFNR